MFQRGEFVLEFFAPDAFAAGAIAKGVTALNHKFFDDAMEDGVVIIAISRMSYKVLNGLGCGVREEADVNVAVGGVDDGGVAGLNGFCFEGGARVEVFGFFVLDVAGGFCDFGFVGEKVEADFAGAGGDEHGVALFGFLEERVVACGHGDGDDAFFLGLALVEGEVQGAEGFVFAIGADDAVGENVDYFDALEGAVHNEVA